jgi:hypothetical protein
LCLFGFLLVTGTARAQMPGTSSLGLPAVDAPRESDFLASIGRNASNLTAAQQSAVQISDILPYHGISTGERVKWFLVNTIGPQGFGVGIVADLWETALNSPEEWGRTWNGMAKRYVAREADVAISNALEAGLGAIWGEDPRYKRSLRKGVRTRMLYAAKTVFVAPRPDGRFAPAWARYAGNVLNTVIEDAWLPPSVSTGRQVAIGAVAGLTGRLAGNLWGEFGHDVRRRFHLFAR